MEVTQRFISLCQKTMSKEDYGDVRKRRIHNRAVDKLRTLFPSLTLEQLELLLEHTDFRVRIYAASACMERNLLPQKSVQTLRNLIVNDPDPTRKMSAAMLLKQYEVVR